MGEMEKKLKGMSKTLMILVIAAIIIVAAVAGAYWWLSQGPGTPSAGINLNVSPAPKAVDETGGYAEPGEDIVVSGSTNPTVSDATITLSYTKPDGSSFNRTTTTDSDGKFIDTYSSSLTDPTGKWTTKAQIGGNTSDPTAFYLFKGETKIGVIGPMDWIQGTGQAHGTKLAATEINDAGGVLGHKWVVLTENDGGEDPDVATLAISRLAPKVDFLMGGFRTEAMFPMREIAMDHKKIFIMTGSATTELINCWQTPAMGCGKCVREDYDRYKYLFRVTPPNSSGLFTHMLVPYVKHYVIPELLIPIVGKPVKIAVLVEMAAWTNQLRSLIEAGGDLFFSRVHPYNVTDYTARVVYTSYPSPTATDFSVELQEIEDRGVHLIIHVFSAKAGQIFTTQWGERPKKAIPIGVNVLGQENSHWDITEGKCEYEIVASTPPRINVNERVIPFWDRYVEMWDEDPIYTAFGTYDAMTILTAAIERAGTFDPDAHPETEYVAGMNRTRGRLIKELEETDMEIVMGKFKFTTYHGVLVEATKDPPGTGAYWYTDPDKRDLPAEDIFYINWLSSEYVVPLLIQWYNGERIVVFPLNQTYTEDIQFPTEMYP